MKFSKYHALGNDYLVIDPKDAPSLLTEAQIRVICHRNFGVGSDGILLGPLPADEAEFALRIFNPDGSEAEKSRSEEHTSELQSPDHLVCRLLLEKKKKKTKKKQRLQNKY